MPTIRIRFPGGRYHATPAGHHVNEGQIEWPPSPWRVVRALIACGFTTQSWMEIPTVAQHLFEKLAGILPSYCLPSASASHTRHFMPTGSLDVGREKTTLVFDTWADVGNDVLAIHWDCNLTTGEFEILRVLAENLGYLGRSESWVVADLLDPQSDSCDSFNAFPHRDGVRPGPEWEQISVIAPIPANEYTDWQKETVARILATVPLPDGKKKPPAKLLKERENLVAPYPVSLLDCLVKDTSWWKEYGWSQPPGSQRVVYWRRTDSLQVAIPQDPKLLAPATATAVLLAITTPSGRHSGLPMCNRTLPQAELFHRAIVGRAAKGELVHCPELTGRDDEGNPLRDRHQHAHILPVDLDSDGRIDHIVIYSPMGLGDRAQRAIRTMRRTWTKKGAGELQVAVAAIGNLDTLRSLPAPFNQRIDRFLGPTSGARIWVSATPFVPPRFLKRRGKNSLLGQINAELTSRGFPKVETIDHVPWTPESLPLRHFVRRRTHGGKAPPVDLGFVIRLEFRIPVKGPLALGYASHFGMGRFDALVS